MARLLMLALALPATTSAFLNNFARPMSTSPDLANVVGVSPSKAMVADYGFDPLGFSKIDLNIASAWDKNRDVDAILYDYRDAELRHGRLAMLCALAWPVQELLSPTLSRALRAPMLLAETAGRSPSVLNGGLEQSGIPLVLLATAALIAKVDLEALKIKENSGDAWVPGDFGWDPLKLLAGASPVQRRDMQAKEINNGRLAMVAVAAYVVQEAVTGLPITYTSSALFTPIFLNPAFRAFMDGAFSSSTFHG